MSMTYVLTIALPVEHIAAVTHWGKLFARLTPICGLDEKIWAARARIEREGSESVADLLARAGRDLCPGCRVTWQRTQEQLPGLDWEQAA